MKSPKGRILCTEDDPDTRELIIYSLTQAGFETICAGTAKDTVSLALTQKFDLFVLDNWMPEISGLDLCKQIRMFDSKTPILFYSGAVYEADKQRALEAGAQAYLVKPVANDMLVTEAIRLISESQSHGSN